MSASAVTQVTFHFNVPQRLIYACRVVRKALRAGQRVAVVAEPEVLDELDHHLWHMEAVDFLPHLRVREASEVSSSSALALTPVWLVANESWAQGFPVLINLKSEPVKAPQHFAKLIEVVSTEGVERELGRQRWKHYKAQGLDIQTYEVALS